MTDRLDLRKIIDAVQLRDVRVVDVAANTSIRSASEVGDVQLFVDWGAKPKSRVGNDFVIEAAFQARVARADALGVPVVRIRTVFDLTYHLPQEIVAEEKELNAFANVNGTFNAWPYARALIQSLSVNMNLPPITIPVFRLKDLAQSTQQEPRPVLGNVVQKTSKRESRGRTGRHQRGLKGSAARRT